MRSLEDCRLYGFIDEAYRQGRSYETLAKALCNGGVDIIQLRMKEAIRKHPRSRFNDPTYHLCCRSTFGD